ncbi:hypothetical protein C8R44DRAFT_879243 [Mycena epipterygia]|nr:hypothetical protein C8R44DRAFT_879243 [Mycena epipterygia]
MKFDKTAVTTLANVGQGIRDILNARKGIVDLSYYIATLQADFAEQQEICQELLAEKNNEINDLQVAEADLLEENRSLQDQLAEIREVGVDLLEENDKLEVLTEHLALELDLQQATADQFRELASHQQVIVEAGILYVERLSEELYRTEARARDTQFLLMDDLDRKKDVIETQEAQIAKLHKKSDAANAHIATLEAKIVADGAKYRALLAHSQMIHTQTEQIASLTSTIHTLQHHAAVALAAHTAEVARANADAKTIIEQAGKIEELEAAVVRFEESAAQALNENVKKGKKIAYLNAHIKELEAQACEVTTKGVLHQLRVAEHIEGLEKRAREAEERAASLEREKIDTADKTKATIAVLHAKEHAAVYTCSVTNVDADLVDVPATTVPQLEITTPATVKPSSKAALTLDCGDHFSTPFVAFVQASFSQSGNFAKDGRKILRRAASTHVVPRLFFRAAAAAGLTKVQ